MKDITKNQLAVLVTVDGFITKKNYPPSYREISEGTEHISISAVKQCLDKLATLGAIDKPAGRIARCIRVTEKGKSIILSSRSTK